MRTQLLCLALLLTSCVKRVEPLSGLAVDALVGAADRSDEDKALDPGRRPAQFLAFLKLAPGMQVAELMAGGGYTTALLSRAVGPSGTVYGENPKVVLERFAEKPWTARLAHLANTKRLDTELDAPFPTALDGALDVVVSNAIYHDTVWLETDRQKMNTAVFRALRQGGAYVVCDSSAKEGSGLEAAQNAAPHRRAGRARGGHEGRLHAGCGGHVPPQPGRHARLERLASRRSREARHQRPLLPAFRTPGGRLLSQPG